MLRVAQAVIAAGVVAIGRPAVMDGDPREAGRHTGGVDRLAAASGVRDVARQLGGRRAVHPAQAAGDPCTGLVDVRDRRRLKQPAQTLIAQPVGCGRRARHQRACQDPRAGDVAQRLGRAVGGQVLKGAQLLHAERSHPAPALRRRADRGPKPAGADVPATAAPARGDVVDNAQQRALGQIEDLARLTAHSACAPARSPSQRSQRSGDCATATATRSSRALMTPPGHAACARQRPLTPRGKTGPYATRPLGKLEKLLTGGGRTRPPGS